MGSQTWQRLLTRFSKRCLIFFVLLSSILVLAPDTLYANVTKKFLVARKLFERNRIRQSERVFRRILKQYPDHKPSIYMMGRIFYRYGKTRRAARFFRKAGPAYITSDSAFEFGITMFSIKKYNLALRGLRRVPKRSPNKGIANFYAGVSYYNLRNWRQAESYLSRSRGLPRKLENSRREILREARRQTRIETAGALRPQRPLYIPPPTQQYSPYYQQPQQYPGYPYGGAGDPPPLPPGAGAPPPEVKKPEKKKAPPKPAAPTYGYSSSMTPRFNYSQENIQNDKHAFALDEKNTQGFTAGIGSNIRYDTKSSTDYDLLIDVGITDKNITGANITNKLASEDEPGNIITERTNKEPSKDKKAVVQLKPGVTVPLGKDLTLKGAFDFVMTLPEMRFEDASHNRTPSGTLEFSVGDVSVDLSAQITEKVNAESVTTDQVTVLKGNADKSFGEFSLNVNGSFTTVSDPAAASIGGFEQNLKLEASVTKPFDPLTVTVKGTNSQNTPPSGAVVAGTQSSNTIAASVNLPFDFGISLSGGAKMVLIDQYITQIEEGEEDAKTKVNLPASGQTTGFNISAKITPVEWGNLSASYSRDETGFAAGNKEREVDFQKNTVDIVTSTSFAIAISTSF